MFSPTPVSRYIIGPLQWYSTLILGAIVLSFFLAKRDEKRLGLPKDIATDAFFYIVPAGVIGARVYYVVFKWHVFRENPIEMLYIWQGGLAIYGALIGGFLGLVLYVRRNTGLLPRLLDIYAPCLAISQAIGRWGNYFNQEAYGYAVINPSHQFFPMAVKIVTGISAQWHYATFFYEFLWNSAVFVLLSVIKKRLSRTGDLFICYIMCYGFGRAIIEGMRSDSLMAISGRIRVSQWLSAALFVAAILYFSIRRLYERNK